MELRKQRIEDTFTIVDVLDEDNKVIGWTVADNNLERVTDRLFVKSAYEAFVWACDNYRGLV